MPTQAEKNAHLFDMLTRDVVRLQGDSDSAHEGLRELRQRVTELENIHKADIANGPNDMARQRLWRLVNDGLLICGEHHKQWYLEQIAGLLGLGIPSNAESGIAP